MTTEDFMVNWKYYKNKSTVLYLAPESECAIIQFFWLGIARYGDFHLSACRKKFDSLLLSLFVCLIWIRGFRVKTGKEIMFLLSLISLILQQRVFSTLVIK